VHALVHRIFLWPVKGGFGVSSSGFSRAQILGGIVEWFTDGMMDDAECSWMIHDMVHCLLLSVCVHSQEIACVGIVMCGSLAHQSFWPSLCWLRAPLGCHCHLDSASDVTATLW
jgi:hypothetical protein